MGKKAAILARISRDTQDTESQIESLVSDANSFGYEIPSNYIFSENITGMDSYDKDERESIQALKFAIENNKDIECVYMWELTRLSRNPYFLIDQLRYFNEHRIPIYFHDIDKWTMDRFNKTENNDTTNYIFGAATYGQVEWQKIRNRTMRGRDAKAKKGLFVGHISDGYCVKLEGKEKHIIRHEERAEIIKEIFYLYTEKGYSTYKIASELNERNVLCYNAWEAKKNENNENFRKTYKLRNTNVKIEKSNTKWTSAAISQVLKNRWYIGERSYKGFNYNVPPIIEMEQFEKANSILVYNKKELPKRRDRVYCLSRMFFCGKCGNLMHGHKVRINTSYYCGSQKTGRKCGIEGICKENVEAIVWDLIFMNVVGNIDDYNIHSLFKISKENIDNLISDIDKFRVSIQRKEKGIESNIAALSNLYTEKAKAKNKYAVNALIKSISTIERENEMLEKEIKDIRNEIIVIQSKIDANNSLDNVLESISSKKDINSIKEIMSTLINRVILYNLENYYKLIVVEYKSMKCSAAIYNARKLKEQYINLDILYNNFHIFYDGSNFINNHALISINEKKDINISENNIDAKEKLLYTINGYKILNNSQLFLEDILTFFSDFTFKYNRIEDEPSDEEYKKWKSDYKRWSQQRNERRTAERRAKK